MPSEHVGQSCKRCNALEAALTVRSDPLCRDCFIKYVQTKVIKRMEAFRTRHAHPGQQRKLLLPISFGASSVTLLYILDKHLQAQISRTGRTGFTLHVIHLFDLPSTNGEGTEKFDLIKERFPSHEYSTISLDELYSKQRAEANENSDPDHSNLSINGCPVKSLENLLAAIPSATPRSDVLSILQTRLAVKFAKESSCEGILWGDSTTKLAETVLAETAKGRGFSLPWHVTDGDSPYGIPFFYPMRNVLKKEILSHVDLVEPSLRPLISAGAFVPTQAPPSGKNTTIDVLMQQYFESVEENYPSVVSNVVRTTGKLHAAVSENARYCRLCKLPIAEDQLGIDGWGGHQGDTNTVRPKDRELCYGCARSIPENTVALLPD